MKAELRAAKIIRVVTVPPVMAAWLILSLWIGRDAVVNSGMEAAVSILFLSLLPLLAYPISMAVPAFRARGRECQRNLAFGLSLVGYIGGWLYGRYCSCGTALLFIFTVYLFSVLILLIFNKLLHLRASGHACSVSGPILVICVVLGGWWLPVCAAVFAASFWSSVRSGRHTVSEYLLGTLSVMLAIAISWCIYLR